MSAPGPRRPEDVLQSGLATVREWIEGCAELDPVAVAVKAQVRRALGPGRTRDVLTGTPLGHPLHPLLVDVPIGCWTSSLLLDVVARRQHRASRRLVGIGVLTALPTAAAGLADWTDTEEAEMRVGLVHAALNVGALGCYTVSWWKRRRGGHAGRAWSLLAIALSSGAGWLGGHLAYGLGVGVDTNAFESGPTAWSPAVGSLPDEGAVARLTTEGVGIAVARREGTDHAMADRCSHRGGPLSEGTIEGDCLVCPWHGSKFRLTTGLPAGGPASEPQPLYELQVRDATVEVRREESRALRQRVVRPSRRS